MDSTTTHNIPQNRKDPEGSYDIKYQDKHTIVTVDKDSPLSEIEQTDLINEILLAYNLHSRYMAEISAQRIFAPSGVAFHHLCWKLPAGGRVSQPPILAVFAVHRGRGDNPELDPPLNFRGDHLWGEQNKSPSISGQPTEFSVG